jgi:hypothetical protein
MPEESASEFTTSSRLRSAERFVNVAFAVLLVPALYLAYENPSSPPFWFRIVFDLFIVAVLLGPTPYSWIPGVPNMHSREFLRDLYRQDYPDEERLEVAVERHRLKMAAAMRVFALVAAYFVSGALNVDVPVRLVLTIGLIACAVIGAVFLILPPIALVVSLRQTRKGKSNSG